MMNFGLLHISRIQKANQDMGVTTEPCFQLKNYATKRRIQEIKSQLENMDKILHAQCSQSVDEYLKDAQNVYQQALSDFTSMEKSALELLQEACREKNDLQSFTES